MAEIRTGRKLLTDAHWVKIERVLPGNENHLGRTGADNRLFADAVLWIVPTSRPWRDLPPELGNWHTTYFGLVRWRTVGVWTRVAEALASDTGLQPIFIDATIVRAHQQAAGVQEKKAAKRSSTRGVG